MPNWKKLIVSGSDANLNSLDITANNTVGGLLKVADGTAAAPSITFTNDTNSGIYSYAADKVAISTGGTERFRVESAGIHSAGNVYSGTNSQFRNYGGVWKATTGVSGNGFEFTSADATALTLDSTGSATFGGGVIIDALGSHGRIRAGGSMFLGGGGTTTLIQFSAKAIPDGDSSHDLGASNRYWKDAYIDTITTTGNIDIGGDVLLDDSKIIKLGDGGTFQIWHQAGTNGNSFIDEQSTGELYIRSNSNINLAHYANNTLTANFNPLGPVELYYSGSKKFETRTGGATVSGSLIVDANTSNLVGSFISTDSIAEIRIQDNSKYTRLLTVGTQFKLMPNNGSETLILDGNDDSAIFAGKINAKGGASITGFTAATINAYTATVSSNLYSALRIVDNTAASTYWDIGAVGGASPDLKFFVNAGTTPKFTLSAAGNATFAGTLTVNGADAITIPDYILHAGDDSKFGFPSNDNFKIRLAGSDVFNMSTTGTTFTGVLSLPDGSVSAPSINNTGDTNTGMYFPGDHQVGFAVNGSRKLYMSTTEAFFQNLSSGVSISAGGIDVTGASTFTDNVSLTGGALSISGDGSNAVTLTESGNGDFTIDAPDDIRLDAGGGDIVFKDDGTEYGRFGNHSGNLGIRNITQDKDIIFKGNDGGTTIDALTLDMSDQGWAHFNTGIAVGNSAATSTFAGDVTVAGTLTAQEFKSEFVSASIVYQSGSTKFGDTSDDVHSFSGSLQVTGSGAHYFTDGKVVVGSTTSNYKFGVTGGHLGVSNGGNIYIGGFGGDAVIGYMGNTSGVFTLRSDGNRDVSIGSGTANNSIFIEGSNGKVGIGTVTPDTQLHVSSSTGFSIKSERAIQDAGRDGYAHSYTAGGAHIFGYPLILERALRLAPSSPSVTTKTYRFLNDSSILKLQYEVGGSTQDSNILSVSGSNIGIGTATPIRTFHVEKATTYPGRFSYNSTNYLDIGYDSLNVKGGSLLFRNDGTEHLRIGTTGALKAALYGSGNFSGTLAYTLGVDSSGNVIEFSGGAGGGAVSAVSSGADNRVAVFSGTDSLEGDTGFTFDGTKLTVEDTIAIQRNGVSAGTSTLQQTGTGLIINAPSGYHPLVLQHNTTELFRLRNDGKLGLGVVTPSTKFQVKSGGADDGIYLVQSGNTNLLGGIIQTGTGDGAIVARNTSNAQTVLFRGQGNNYLTGGSLGIGTTSPDTSLELFKEQDGDYLGLKISKLHSNGYQYTTEYGNNQLKFSGNQNYSLYNDSNRVAEFHNGHTKFYGNGGVLKMNISGSGEVIIGALSSGATGQLVVNQEGGVSPVAKFMSRTNKAIVQVSDNDTTGYLSSENGLLSLGRHAGVNAANININASHNVGIGTSSPAKKLDVVGSFRVQEGTSGTDEITTFNVSSHGNVSIARNHATSPSISTSFSSGNSALSFVRSSATRTKIECDNSYFLGNVGIGSSTPTSSLDVKGITSNTTADKSLARFVETSGTDNGITKKVIDSTISRSSWSNSDQISGYFSSHFPSRIGNSNAYGLSALASYDQNYSDAGSESFAGTLFGIHSKVSVTQTTGNSFAQNAYGLFVDDLTIGANAKLTNYYGIRIAGTTGSGTLTNKYALVTDSDAGNVGFGTTAPIDALQIKGDGKGFYISSADYNVARIIPRGTGSNLDKGLLSLLDAGIEDIRIDAGGHSWIKTGFNLGLGTNTPGYTLDVVGDINTSTGLIRRAGNGIIKSSGAETMIGPGGSGIISFHNSATMTTGDETMRIDANGNLLLNNTSAGARLDIREDSNYAIRAEDASGHYFRVNTGGDTEIRGDLTVQGTVIAQEFHTEFVSASIIYESGSTKFGDTTSDNHDFTGSIKVSGSIDLRDSARLNFGDDKDFHIRHNGSGAYLTNGTGDIQIQNDTNDGDIVFKSDDGSGGVAEYFRVDGGAEAIIVSKTLRATDNVRIDVGSATDGRFYHDGTDTHLVTLTGDLKIRNSNDDGDIIFFSDDGSGGTTQYFRLDGGDARMYASREIRFVDGVASKYGNSGDLGIYHDGTNTYLENNTGDFIFKNNADDKRIRFQCDNGAGGIASYFDLQGVQAQHDGSATTVLYTTWYDNSRIALGNGLDFQMWHDGSNTKFYNQTGDIKVGVTGTFAIQNSSFDENLATFAKDGAVQLFYNSSKKFETTNTGGTLTGTLTVTNDLNVTGDLDVRDIDARAISASSHITGSDVHIDDWGSVSASLSSIQTAGGVNGTGAANRVALWSDGDTLTSDGGLTYSSDTLFLEDADYTSMRINSDVNEHSSVQFMSSSVSVGRIGWHKQGYFGASAMSANPSPAMFVDAPNGFDFTHNNTGSLSIKSGSADVIVDSKVKVGIGVGSPSYPLHVYAGGSERFAISGDVMVRGATDLMVTGTSRRLSFTAGTGTVRTTTSNNLILQTNSTTALTLNTQQFASFATRVGVGVTASTNAMLDVKGPDTDNAVLGRFYSNTGARGSFIIRNGSGVSPTTFIGTAGGSEQLSIGTNNTEAIRIDASSTPNATFAGDVTVNGSHLTLANGTTSAAATDYLYIGGTGLASSDAAIYIGNGGGNTTDGYGYRIYYSGAGTGNNNKLIFKSENYQSAEVDMLTFTADGKSTFSQDATFSGNVTTLGGLTIGDSNADTAQVGLKHLLGYCENTDVDTGTEDIKSLPLATYQAVFFDYVVKNGTNLRAGTVTAVHDGSNVEFTDTSTKDLGNTSAVILSVDISGTNMRLRATTTSDNWIVKANIRGIKV